MTKNKYYTVVMRGPASAIFPEDKCFRVIVPTEEDEKIVMLFRSRYRKIAPGPDVPTDFWVEVTCPAPSLKDALQISNQYQSPFKNVIVFMCNANIGQLEIEIGFERKKGPGKRSFFQRYFPENRIHAIPSRVINLDHLNELLSHIDRSKYKKILIQAISRYSDALSFWHLGDEILALFFLYIGIELITVPSLELFLEKQNKTKKDYIKKWVDEATPKAKQLQVLYNKFREKIIFENDTECFHNAQEARNKLAHGASEPVSLREQSADVLHRTARNLRNTIMEVIGCNDELRVSLLSEPINLPRGQISIERYFWATLDSKSDDLALGDQIYPRVHWTTNIHGTKKDGQGLYSLDQSEEIKGDFAKGVKLSRGRIEHWDGSQTGRRITPDK